jgi:hypothetical protein
MLAETPCGWFLLSCVAQCKVRATSYDPQRDQLVTMSVDGCSRLWSPDFLLKDTVSGAHSLNISGQQQQVAGRSCSLSHNSNCCSRCLELQRRMMCLQYAL